MITLIDPITRLEVLKVYMSVWVDQYPKPIYTFDRFVHKKYRYLIPGTVEYCKKKATHCYYCNRQFSSENAFKASVDHWVPRSVGITEKYVICCVDCNGRKANAKPADLVSKMTAAHLRGKEMWGYHGKKLKYIYTHIQTVVNDALYNRGPRVYWVKR